MANQFEHFEEVVEDHEEFRDRVATIDENGARVWLYPKQPKGRFYNARTWVSLAFVLIFLTLPFIKYNGEPLLLFNVLERKFILFGLLFTAQDFPLFALTMITFIVFIILFTVVYGRLFCGWVCPQTVFMEMIFRRLEYWIEGDSGAQRRLDAAPWTREKIQKKTLKHAVFFGIAVLVSNYFLAYIIGMDQVLDIIRQPLSSNLPGFISMLFFSGVFYGVFSRMREQVCTSICPYGRLQGVLLVKDTIVVAYDSVRGEPRGKIKKNTAEPAFPLNVLTGKPLGDCVDCGLCVAVCPTGIDIRNGTQLECTNCTACIDACDGIMDKVGRQRGLIRYDSMSGIQAGVRKLFTARVYAYSVVLFVLVALDVMLLANRGAVETIILRSPGQLYQEVDATHISNLYTYEIINKTNTNLPVQIELSTAGSHIRWVGMAPDSVAKGAVRRGAFFVDMENAQLAGRKTPIEIKVRSKGKVIDAVKTNFMGPGR